jgi:hypothetical protein
MLLILDDCDFFLHSELVVHFRNYVSELLNSCPRFRLLITCRADLMNRLEGVTQSLIRLEGLGPLDSAKLLYLRRPRDLSILDYKDSLGQFIANGKPLRVEQFAKHSIFALMLGNPGLIERCADLLKFLPLDHLYSYLQHEKTNVDRLSDEVRKSLETFRSRYLHLRNFYQQLQLKSLAQPHHPRETKESSSTTASSSSSSSSTRLMTQTTTVQTHLGSARTSVPVLHHTQFTSTFSSSSSSSSSSSQLQDRL